MWELSVALQYLAEEGEGGVKGGKGGDRPAQSQMKVITPQSRLPAPVTLALGPPHPSPCLRTMGGRRTWGRGVVVAVVGVI